MKINFPVVVLAFATLSATALEAKVELAGPFSDGAVLQRGMRVPVWGKADPGERVRVAFAGQRVEAVAGEDGSWRAYLEPMEACAEGRMLRAAGEKAPEALAVVRDVLVGEVWFCSGQSNTELPLVGGSPRFRDAKGAMRAQMTMKPLVRFCYQSTYHASAEPRRDFAMKPEWKPFTPENLLKSPSFSAMGVYFALELHSALGIPVGIVGAYWGGTPIEAWTPKSGFISVPATARYADVEVFSTADFEAAKKAGRAAKARQQDQPRALWNEMVSPWTPYAIRGFIWYQGCNNAKEGLAYADKMHALYNGWAAEFENPALKIRFVQLAPWGFEGIARIQMGQAKFAAEEPNAGMAVINDIGNLTDIHPNDKETVGQRLALLALKRDYGFDGIKADSPLPKSCRREGDALVVEMANADSLYVYDPGTGYTYNAEKSLNAGLEVCGADGQWQKAEIRNLDGEKGNIKGARLVVGSKGVAEPRKVRYLFNRPWFGCIYNEVNLPLGAFEAEIAE